MALVFTILGFIDKQKFGIVVSVIIIASLLIYFLYYKPNYVDPNIGENVLAGSWTYNDVGGVYVFNEDKIYYQYITDDKEDNYCTGKYRYTYGVETTDGDILIDDPDYTYYYLVLKPEKCVLTGKEEPNTDNKYDKQMVFGYRKNKSNESLMINLGSGNKSKLKKVE